MTDKDDKPAEDKVQEKPTAAAEVKDTLPSRTLYTILNGMVNGGKPAKVNLNVVGAAAGKLTVSALNDLGEVLGTYELSEAGVKPL